MLLYFLLLLAAFLLALLLGAYQIRQMYQRIQALEAASQQQEERQHAQLKAMARRLDNYLSSSMQMGDELHELREQLAPLPDKVMQMEQRDPGGLSFIEAAKLLGLGANTEDLQSACGLTQAEAELLQRMHAGRQQAP